MPNGRPAITPKDEVPQFEDLTTEQQEALAGKAAANGEDGAHHVATAYVIAVERDGTVAIVPDLTLNFIADRQPTMEDILGSTSVAKVAITAQMTAATTQQVMLQQARAMAQQQQQAQAVQQMQGMNLRS